MEFGLKDTIYIGYISCVIVSILVVMEFGLKADRGRCRMAGFRGVSILVVMEFGLKVRGATR